MSDTILFAVNIKDGPLGGKQLQSFMREIAEKEQVLIEEKLKDFALFTDNFLKTEKKEKPKRVISTTKGLNLSVIHTPVRQTKNVSEEKVKKVKLIKKKFKLSRTITPIMQSALIETKEEEKFVINKKIRKTVDKFRSAEKKENFKTGRMNMKFVSMLIKTENS